MKKKRAGGVLAAVFAAAALPIVVASPASADQGDCQIALYDWGYVIGPKVQAACKAGAAFGPAAYGNCFYGLVNIGVRSEHAANACSDAQM
ncbi:hypothetical protein ACLF6K_28305 [Streptomyces xanthophaeus]|uniref:hypothetical protein n=1 Tax=Streptomyces xanthophaeus TaxID=67385 RepID=UPI00398FAB9D